MQQRQAMGQAIKKARDRRGLVLRELSTRLAAFGLALDHNALSRIERGERGLDVRELLVIAAALDTSPDVLVFPGGERDPLAITETLQERAGKLRDWWSGRSPLLGTVRRSGPSWPFPDEVSPDTARDRIDFWRARRPVEERHAFGRDGIERMAQLVASVIKVAGRGKLSAGDRRELFDHLLDLGGVVHRQLKMPDLTKTPMDRERAADVEAAWTALAAEFERSDR